MAVFALMMAAALLAGDPDGVVATAPATSVDLGATAQPLALSTGGAAREAAPHGLSTDAQIDRWIAARSTEGPAWAESREEPKDEDRVHGAVTFGIGTGGYRDYGAAVSVPLGEHGRLEVSYRQVENGYPHIGYGDGYGYGHGYGYGADRGWYGRGAYGFADPYPDAVFPVRDDRIPGPKSALPGRPRDEPGGSGAD